jgi:sugar lactone lactonase YvrE
MKKLFAALVAGSLTLGWAPSSAADVQTLNFTTLAGQAGTLVKSVDGTGSAAQFYMPRGVAVDGIGNVYVADSSNHSIRKITAAGVVTTLAGTPGTAGPAPRFSEPFSVAVDASGTVFVADTNNNAIRKITAAGVVSTLAGGSGMGSADGTGAAAKFAEPRGIALDSGGNLYVADYMNDTIRKLTPAGVVTTIAGAAGTPGFVNGQASAARFKAVNSIAIDTTGNLYVADTGNRAIRKISSSGVVTTFADGSNGQFGEPRGVAVDAAGNVYVSDYTAHVIYRVTTAGAISKLAGTAPLAGSTDGTTGALFNAPSGIAVDSANNVYVADTANSTIRKVSSGGAVTTLAGLAGRSASVDGKGAAARFEDPYAVATDGTYVYVADPTDHTVRKVAADGTTTTLAGAAGTFGSTDGTGSAARFNEPRGIAADSTGTVYIADTGNSTIRKISAAGVVTTLAGTAGAKGSLDATGAAARFAGPTGVAVDGAGNVFAVASESSTLRKITPTGVVTTVAGSAGSNGFVNGIGSAARFSNPYDVAIDTTGNLYVLDRNNHAVRKVTPAGVVTTLAGSGNPGYADGNGATAMFKFPSGLTVDSSGNVFVADTDNQVLRKISPAGDVTTIAGSVIGSTDGLGTAASFYNPKDVAADLSGNIYVADRGNHTIRKGSPQATAGCSYALSASSLAAGASGTAGNLTVTAAAGCGWTAISNVSWIAITSSTVGSGNGNIVYSIAANTGASSRSGTLTVAGQVFTVSQAGSGQSGNPYMGLWWNPAESGWGISVTQHNNILAAAIYTYEPGAQPVWYVIPNCPLAISGRCTGDAYKVTGGTQPGVPWDGTGKTVVKAGSGSLSFSDASHGVFDFTLNGLSGSKTIERQLFASGTAAQAVDYTDLWWNAAESGWGVSLTQDAGMLFAAWFTYDAGGIPVWYVASSCPLTGGGCSGELYKVSGGNALTSPWAPKLLVSRVGSVSFAFSDTGTAIMSYTLNGVAGSKAITRQPF